MYNEWDMPQQTTKSICQQETVARDQQNVNACQCNAINIKDCCWIKENKHTTTAQPKGLSTITMTVTLIP